MTLRIAIVDDQKEDRDTLRNSLKRTHDTGEPDVFEDAEGFLEVFNPRGYDLVFLDIQMDGMNGIELAKKLREMDPHLLIAFQTTSRDYAFETFSIHPFDYIVKPYDNDEINRVVKEVIRVLGQTVPEITVKVAYGELQIPIDSIISVHSDKHYVFLKLTEGDPVRCLQPFSSMTELLSEYPCFLACNRGIFINMDHADFIDESGIHMEDGEIYPLRSRDKHSLTMAFSQYQIKRMTGKE